MAQLTLKSALGRKDTPDATCAKIVGVHPDTGLIRKFLQPDLDTTPFYACFHVEQPGIYELRNFRKVGAHRTQHKFIAVTAGADLTLSHRPYTPDELATGPNRISLVQPFGSTHAHAVVFEDSPEGDTEDPCITFPATEYVRRAYADQLIEKAYEDGKRIGRILAQNGVPEPAPGIPLAATPQTRRVAPHAAAE